MIQQHNFPPRFSAAAVAAVQLLTLQQSSCSAQLSSRVQLSTIIMEDFCGSCRARCSKCRLPSVPWWVWVFAPYILWGVPDQSMTNTEWFLLGQLGLVTAFDQYEMSLLAYLLPQIQKTFAIPEENLGSV